MRYQSDHYGIMKIITIYGLLAFVLVKYVAASTTNVKSSWYKGCYLKNPSSAQVLAFRPNGVDLRHITAANCSLLCAKSGYNYAGIQRDTSCTCSNRTDGLSVAPDRHCNTSCQDGGPMPCGDAGVVAVYSTLGPYLHNITIEIDHALVVGLANQIEVIVRFFGAPENVSTGWSTADPAVVNVTWTIDGAVVSRQQSSAVDGVAKLVLDYKFDKKGQHVIGVSVSNTVSKLTTSVNHSAVFPKPLGLQVALKNDSKTLPTCIPKAYAPFSARTVAVFVDQLVAFEISLKIGVNLTITLEFSDDGSRHVSTPYKENPPCSGRSCLRILQVHTFNTTGRHSLNITVENVFGTLVEQVDVVVVDHALSNISIRLDPSTAGVAKINTPVKFYISVVTASRQTSYLRIRFSQNTNRSYYLWDENGDMIGAPPTSQEYIRLLASYDDRCLLSVEVDHVYSKEGVFDINVECYNSYKHLVAAKLNTSLTVLHELTGLSILLPAVVAVKSDFQVTASLVMSSVSMVHKWRVTNADSSYDKTYRTSQSEVTLNFPNTGHYTVSLVVSNLLGSVSSSRQFVAMEKIAGLTLKSSQNKFVRLRDPVTLTASYAEGSDVKIMWNLGEGHVAGPVVTVSNKKSTDITHVFKKAKTYNVSVTAKNDISMMSAWMVLTVQEGVSNLILSTLGPVILGEASTIIYRTGLGTGVKYAADFGSGRRPLNGTLKNGSLHVTHVFPTSGTHVVTIFAHNNFSEVKGTVDVQVQVRVERVTIMTTNIGALVVNETVIMVVMSNGAILMRRDVLYTWTFLNKKIITRIPMLQYVFPSAGQVNINVTVHNLVSSFTATKSLHINPSSQNTRLFHDSVYEFGVGTKFTITSVSVGAEVEVEYGDGSKKEKFSMTRTSHTWEHTYSFRNFYKVQVYVAKDQSMYSLTSYLSVQDRITALSLSGPRGVPIQSLIGINKWVASLGSGTDEFYKWTVDGNVTYTPGNVLYQKFAITGVYDITCEAMNSVSSQGARTPVIVQHPISAVRIAISPAIHNRDTSKIEIFISGGRKFWLAINFGDGFKSRYSSADKSLKLTTLRESVNNSAVPEYKVEISHSYSNIGNFRVSVNASNNITHMEVSETAIVDEPIGGVVLSSDAERYIPAGAKVTSNVTVASGNDLTFVWDFSDELPSTIENYGNYSVASHEFRHAGIYNISVAIRNALYKKPIVVSLPFLVTALVNIQQVSVAPLTKKYGAAFDVTKNSTDAILFEAFAKYGSAITFHFYFGDGAVVSVVATKVFPSNSYGKASHKYKKEGVYRVKVIASNALGNVTVEMGSQFWVQVPPGSIRLPKKCPTCPNAVRVSTSHTWNLIRNTPFGTDVKYDWNLGDGREIKDGGTSVTHRYTRIGQFPLEVKAYNKAGGTSFIATILVQDLLQDCLLTASRLSVFTKSKVLFKATSEGANYFQWDFGDTHPILEFKSEKEKSYSKPGSYVVKVIAFNYVSNATSNMVTISVYQEINTLAITDPEDIPVNQQILFRATYYAGNDLTFTWDFGDGKPVLSTKKQEVNYTYPDEGEYNVTLVAKNDMSNATAHLRVFALQKPCRKPKITFLGADVHKPVHYKFFRSQMVRFEIDALVNCSMTAVVIFKWTIYKHGPNGERVLVQIAASITSKKMFLMRSHQLEYGNYTAVVRLEMGNGSIVYSKEEVMFIVEPSRLRPLITGGILRNISMQKALTIDASKSYDPDYPNATDIRYNWTCSELNNPRAKCFKNGSNVLRNDSKTISLHGSMFRGPHEYVVNLTITRAGRQPQYTTQVLRVSKADMLDVWVKCPPCSNGPVNSNYRLKISAGCDICDDNDASVTYEWEVYLLSEVNEFNYAGAHNIGACVEADGSTYVQYMRLMNSMTTTPAPSLNGTTEAPTKNPANNSSTGNNNGSTNNGSQNTNTGQNTNNGNSNNQNTGGTGGGSNLPFPSIGEGTSGGRGKRNIIPNTHSRSRRNNANSGIRTNMAMNPLLNIGEGSPSSGGSSSSSSSSGSLGNGLPMKPSEGSTSGRGEGQGTGSGSTGNNNQGNTLKNNTGGDPVVDSNQQGTVDPHIISKSRYKIRLLSENTTTGLNHADIVFRPGFLKQGRTYIVTVKVIYKKGPKVLSGEALTVFEVNESPNRGQCRFSPSKGMEKTTDFNIFCHEWKDRQEDTPLSYEFSYSLTKDETRNVISSGHKKEITFQLPAGLPSQDHKVLVSVAIFDRRGARTSVCRRPLVVKKAISQGGPEKTEEDIRIEEYYKNDEQEIKESIEKGNSKDARSKIRVVCRYLDAAARLNRSRQPDREEIKKNMLECLAQTSIRDNNDALQTMSTVRELTSEAKDMSKESVKDAAEILALCSKMAKDLEKDDHLLSRDLLRLSVESSSNIIQATNAMPKKSKDVSVIKDVMEQNENSMHELLKACTKDHTPYEDPVGASAPLVEAKAQGVRDDLLDIRMGGAQFTMDLRRKSKRLRRDTGMMNLVPGLCYRAHMILFQQDPYVFAQQPKHEVSAVASLNLYHCNGTYIHVRRLPPNQHIHIKIPRKETRRQKYTAVNLKKENMNLHKFNITKDNFNQTLHIILDLDPVNDGKKPFPIAVLVNIGARPTPTKYSMKKVSMENDNRIELMTEAGHFTSAGEYFLAIVDANYNEGRPRNHIARERNYNLNIYWEACMFWDMGRSSWLQDGCRVNRSSTLEVQHCICDHLTSFGAHISLVPNDLSFVNVEEFFDLHENPVIVVFILVIFLIFAVGFAISHRMDSHDLKKGSVVYLQDNTFADRQRYEIIVETGFRKNAGTTSKVSLVLHGEEGISETRELVDDSNLPLFERNSRDIFVLTLPDSLGPIWKVQFWHNNSGTSPSWYLSRVIVRDINLNSSYYFQCEKWFAVEEEDGKVEQEFMTLEGGLGFRKIIWVKGTEYFADYHLWCSLFTRPSYSRFLRSDRLTCCLSLLMSYMCLTAMWYQTKETEYRGEFGLIDVSWRAVVVGMLTTLIVVPVNLALVMLFRKSKIKKQKNSADKKYRSVVKDNHSSNGSSNGNYGPSVQPVMTQSLLDQSILNWQSLQEWAEKQWTKRYQQSVTSSAENVKPQPVPQVQQVKETPAVTTEQRKADETDQTSSGFEDFSSQQVQSPQPPVVRNSIADHSVSSAGIDPIITDPVKKEDYTCLLPWGCRYITLIVAWLIILGCAAVTILYGFRFGRTKSIQWIQSLFFSFMMCVFITHPILILILTIYTAVKYRHKPSVLDHNDDDRDIEVRERQKPFNRLDYYEDCDDLEKGIAARQRSRYLRFARPPQEKQLIEARKKTIKEKKAMKLYWDSVKYLVVFIVAMFVAFGKDIQTPYHLNEAVKIQFTKTYPNPFHGIRSVRDWWRWSMSDLLDSLFWEAWYNGQDTGTERHYIMGGTSTIVGQISLRQVRVQNKSCDVKYPYNVTDRCYYGYGSGETSTKRYGPDGIWSFTEWLDSYYHKFYGRVAAYDGSGFVVKLNGTRSSAYSQLYYLQQNKWVDRHTRALIVEFTLYNAPTNLFTSVSLLVEVLPTGGANPMIQVDSAYMYRYFHTLDHAVLAFELIFICIIMFKMQSFIAGAIRERKHYFKNLWNILHLLQLLVSVVYIVCYILRFVFVHDTIEKLRATFLDEYVDVFFITLWDELLRCLVGLFVFILFVQFLRLLRYRKLFARLGNVYRRARWEILLFTASFILVLLAYTSLGVALFRTVSWSFSEFPLGLMAIANLLVLNYEFSDIENYNLHGARVFVCVFLVFGTGFLISYMVAVLTVYFRVARHEQVLTMSSKELLRFYWQRFLTWLRVRKIAQIDDDDSVLPAEFTMAEIEYQVDELLFKMNAISGSHGLPEKPPCYYTDSDCTYGIGDDGISSGGSEVRGFDEMRFEQRIAKIEDNLYAEPHLAQLIQLDNIGTNILSQEKEKQLRSELELEIFRQLQLQRQEGKSQTATQYDSSNSSVLQLSIGNQNSGNQIPQARKSTKKLFPKPPDLGKLNYPEPFIEESSHATQPSFYDNQIPVHDGRFDDYASMEVVSMDDETVTRPAYGRKRGSSKFSSEEKMRRRGSSKTRSILDLPPGGDILDIPIHRLDDNLPSSRHSGGKSRPFDYIYDSSSSSEFEVLRRSRRAKAEGKLRSLRKTKSRGKGKGHSKFASMRGLEEFGAENGGYSSDSDINVRASFRGGPGHKQCWS